jgi:hypothetical protein
MTTPSVEGVNMTENDTLGKILFLRETAQESPGQSHPLEKSENGITILARRKLALRVSMGEDKTYGQLAEELTEKVGKLVSKGAVYKFIHDPKYSPTGNHLREAFGLPLLRLAEACPRCGIVHVSRRCPNGHSRPRPPRIAIRKDDAASAARTIANNLPPEVVAEIARMLGGKS